MKNKYHNAFHDWLQYNRYGNPAMTQDDISYELQAFILDAIAISPNAVSELYADPVYTGEVGWIWGMDFIETLVRRNPDVIIYPAYRPDFFTADTNLVMIAVQNKPSVLKYLKYADVLNYRDVAIEAVRQDGMLLRIVKTPHNTDPDVISAALQNNVMAMVYVTNPSPIDAMDVADTEVGDSDDENDA